METKIIQLLFEAYRRNDMARFDKSEQAKPLHRRWLGLGTAAAYRSVIQAGLMTFHNGNIPHKRCMGWLCLTDKGIIAMKTLAAKFRFQEQIDLKSKYDYKKSIEFNYMLFGGLTVS